MFLSVSQCSELFIYVHYEAFSVEGLCGLLLDSELFRLVPDKSEATLTFYRCFEVL